MYYISAVKTWFVQWTRRIVLMKTLKIVFKKKKQFLLLSKKTLWFVPYLTASLDEGMEASITQGEKKCENVSQTYSSSDIEKEAT